MAKIDLLFSINELAKGFKDLVRGNSTDNSKTAIHSISQLVATLASFHGSKILNVKTSSIAATTLANKILKDYRANQKVSIDDILDLAGNITSVATIVGSHFNPSIKFLSYISRAISVFGILNKHLSKSQLQKNLTILKKIGSSIYEFKDKYIKNQKV